MQLNVKTCVIKINSLMIKKVFNQYQANQPFYQKLVDHQDISGIDWMIEDKKITLEHHIKKKIGIYNFVLEFEYESHNIRMLC